MLIFWSRDMNSSTWVATVILSLRKRIHLLWSSYWTDLFFLLTSSMRYGARFLVASPSSQLWCQNYDFILFPIVTMVEALNSNLLVDLQGKSDLAQAWS
jgi:hypothetical protein